MGVFISFESGSGKVVDEILILGNERKISKSSAAKMRKWARVKNKISALIKKKFDVIKTKKRV